MLKYLFVLIVSFLCACSSVSKSDLSFNNKELGIKVSFPEGWQKIACSVKNTSAYAYKDRYFCWITVKPAYDLELYPINRNFKIFENDNINVFKVSNVLGSDDIASFVEYLASFDLSGKNYMGSAIYGNNNVAEYNIIFFSEYKRFARDRDYLSSLQKNISIKDKELAYVFDIKQQMLFQTGPLKEDQLKSELKYAKNLFEFRETAPDNLARAIDSLRVLLFKMKLDSMESGELYEEALRLLFITKDALNLQYNSEKTRLLNQMALLEYDQALETAHYLMKLFTDHSDRRYKEIEKLFKQIKKKAKSNDKG